MDCCSVLRSAVFLQPAGKCHCSDSIGRNERPFETPSQRRGGDREALGHGPLYAMVSIKAVQRTMGLALDDESF